MIRPPPTPSDAAAFYRARRGKNLVLFLSLLGFALLFFAISVVKMKR